MLLQVVMYMFAVGAAAVTETSPRCSGEADHSLIPHPTKCAQYYNCSDSARFPWWEDNLQECPHPQLFNDVTGRCEHYSMVKCNDREEAFYQCDYRVYNCERHAHCMPCRYRYPSCKGLPDGFNANSARPESPYYVICQFQRVVHAGVCVQDYKRRIFDTARRMCL